MRCAHLIITATGNSLHLLTHLLRDQLLVSNDTNALWEKLSIVLHIFNSSGARFICKIALIISSYWGSVTGHFAPGSVPISCHIISCFVRVTLAQNREAAPAAAVIRKMFISKWCFFNRNKRHIAITAQLVRANSFIFRFSPRFFSSSKSLVKKTRTKGYNSSLKRQWVFVPTPCYKIILQRAIILCANLHIGR